MPTAETSWHLDKKVPITLIISIVVQTAVGVWFLAGLSYQIGEVSNHNIQQDSRINALETVTQGQAVLTATVTQQIMGLKDTLDQVRVDQRENNTLLRQLLEKQP